MILFDPGLAPTCKQTRSAKSRLEFLMKDIRLDGFTYDLLYQNASVQCKCEIGECSIFCEIEI